MSSLGVMIPAQFGTPYGHSFESSNFMMDHSSGTHQQHHSRTSSSTPAYAASYSSSPALLATSPSMSDRRQSGVNPQSSVPSYSSRSVPIGAYEVPQGLMQSPPAASAYPPVSSVAPSVFNLPAPSPSSYPPPQQAPVHGQIGGYPYGHSFSR
ncbi:hypothetical protein M501DRAFT_1004336 [Patellaria atrata CBS 101060]|uniref:Uncharacterized protein n=1 Tax=Patellaria atrata CBS 101060 TaxID=1346257 RepID=A0A9P4VR79_9PEZI|nr:hypothetical protein M501DRAFT_1004336 [Patellaria atrata CBS 101060]